MVEAFSIWFTRLWWKAKDVKLSGFGNFQIRRKAPRPGRNPRTGEEIPINARHGDLPREPEAQREWCREMFPPTKSWSKVLDLAAISLIFKKSFEGGDRAAERYSHGFVSCLFGLNLGAAWRQWIFMDRVESGLPPIPAKRYFTIGEVSELCLVSFTCCATGAGSSCNSSP